MEREVRDGGWATSLKIILAAYYLLFIFRDVYSDKHRK